MITFYVSGHGYGHAARTGALIAALQEMRPDCPVAVRTEAPREFFPPRIAYTQARVDGSIVESVDTLAVELGASARNARDFLSEAERWLETEKEWLHRSGTQLIAADMPYLPGQLARRAGIPAVAVGNFLWDWILEPAGDTGVLTAIRAAWSGFNTALRLPLTHTAGWDVFPEVIDVPLLTPQSNRSRSEIRAELGLRRTSVLIGGRARLPRSTIEHIRAECSDTDFLLPDDAPVFSDLVRAADVVVSRLGYSIAAECIAERVRIVYPRRTGFREETEILSFQTPRLTPALPIPVADWYAGNWKPYLQAVLELPGCETTLPTNGSEVCAGHLLDRL